MKGKAGFFHLLHGKDIKVSFLLLIKGVVKLLKKSYAISVAANKLFFYSISL
jgi:hypothetical protein